MLDIPDGLGYGAKSPELRVVVDQGKNPCAPKGKGVERL